MTQFKKDRRAVHVDLRGGFAPRTPQGYFQPKEKRCFANQTVRAFGIGGTEQLTCLGRLICAGVLGCRNQVSPHSSQCRSDADSAAEIRFS